MNRVVFWGIKAHKKGVLELMHSLKFIKEDSENVMPAKGKTG